MLHFFPKGTFDFRNISVENDEDQDKVCLRCEEIANSHPEACLLDVNAIDNETSQLAFTITPDSASIYRTCVDLAPNTYNMTAFDVSSDVGPLTETPAVVVTSIIILPISTNMSVSTAYTTNTPSSNGNLARKPA